MSREMEFFLRGVVVGAGAIIAFVGLGIIAIALNRNIFVGFAVAVAVLIIIGYAFGPQITEWLERSR